MKESLLALSLLTASNGADYYSSKYAINRGGVESNQLMMKNPGAIKIASVAGEQLIFEALKKQNKKFAWAWVGTIVAANIAISYHNHKVMR